VRVRTFLYSSALSNCQLCKSCKKYKLNQESQFLVGIRTLTLLIDNCASRLMAFLQPVCHCTYCLRLLPLHVWTFSFHLCLPFLPRYSVKDEDGNDLLWSPSSMAFLLSRRPVGRADRCCFVSILRPWEAAACSSFFSQIGLGLESVVLFLLSRQSGSTASCLWQEELLFTLFLLLLLQNV
jgi:hypothetical protein